MPWNFNNNTPIYLQIMDHIKLSVAIGEYKAGDKLLPVRELAAEAEVNPNTMQKALSELERDGLLYSQRTSGRYITDDEQKIAQMRNGLATGHMDTFLDNMGELGYSSESALTELKNHIETQRKG